jgi:hypothetical protein
MRLKISTSKNAKSLYVIKSTYENGIRSTKIVEKLGTYDSLLKKLNGQDPVEWAKRYIDDLNRKEKEENREVIMRWSQSRRVIKDEQHTFNGGYLFLQQPYYQLGMDKICRDISKKYEFTYDLNAVLSRLVYSRILFPASKLGTFELSRRFIEQPDFELQHIYRALEVIAKENDFIQSELYKNSLKISERSCGILYYDCTNYFFEIEQEDGLKQYGHSKEHRPNPIVQMGLFMDADGIPLAFCINPGNTNEQTTMQPLEKKILSDFGQSKLIVCTDAGLASTGNRKFNDTKNRAFVTTQSVKTLKAHLKEWALSPDGWHLSGSRKLFDISRLDNNADRDNIFYKERWINENGLEQHLIITYSIKSREYQRSIRNRQIERAADMMNVRPGRLKKNGQNDFRRFVTKTSVTKSGEIAEKEIYGIDTDLIAEEEKYDGFYGICTNLEDDAAEILKVSQRRWQIEECFRIMKTEFKARPVYLSRDDRIKAHFTTCFIALLIYRLLEKRLGEEFTTDRIIQCLRDMNFYSMPGNGFIPGYTRTDLTDVLHKTAGFQTDFQIVSTVQMKSIIAKSKK